MEQERGTLGMLTILLFTSHIVFCWVFRFISGYHLGYGAIISMALLSRNLFY